MLVGAGVHSLAIGRGFNEKKITMVGQARVGGAIRRSTLTLWFQN